MSNLSEILVPGNSLNTEELETLAARYMRIYRIAYTHASDEFVQKYSARKFNKIKKSSEGNLRKIKVKDDETPLSDAVGEALSNSLPGEPIENEQGIISSLRNAENCAENYYLLASIALSGVPLTIERVNDALNYLNRALSYDPTNIAYLGLLETIRIEIELFENDAEAWNQIKQQEFKAKTAAEKRERRRKAFRKFFG